MTPGARDVTNVKSRTKPGRGLPLTEGAAGGGVREKARAIDVGRTWDLVPRTPPVSRRESGFLFHVVSERVFTSPVRSLRSAGDGGSETHRPYSRLTRPASPHEGGGGRHRRRPRPPQTAEPRPRGSRGPNPG